jgi:putative chitinase
MSGFFDSIVRRIRGAPQKIVHRPQHRPRISRGSLQDHLRHLWPQGNDRLIEGIAASSEHVFPKYGINSPLVIAHMMGQFSEECGAGLEMTENMNYSAERLVQVWPTRFTAATAQEYAHKPFMIANFVYGGRMGNAPPPSNDGYDYRGRGLAQTTGREAYGQIAKITGIDVLTHPELLVDPDTCLECAVADYVKICGCLPFAATDDLKNETLRLNGGLIGLQIRADWVNRWKRELGA